MIRQGVPDNCMGRPSTRTVPISGCTTVGNRPIAARSGSPSIRSAGLLTTLAGTPAAMRSSASDAASRVRCSTDDQQIQLVGGAQALVEGGESVGRSRPVRREPWRAARRSRSSRQAMAIQRSSPATGIDSVRRHLAEIGAVAARDGLAAPVDRPVEHLGRAASRCPPGPWRGRRAGRRPVRSRWCNGSQDRRPPCRTPTTWSM